MRKLSQEERAVYGECGVCGAEHGSQCSAVDVKHLMSKMQDGAHLERLYHAPDEVPIVDELASNKAGDEPASEQAGEAHPWAYYVDGLEKVKASGPEWLPETRLMLIMAMSVYMQAAFMSGAQYGAPGIPNMQSLLEIGGQPSNELERVRALIMDIIDNALLPFFHDGKLPGMQNADSDSDSDNHTNIMSEIIAAGIVVGKALRGIEVHIKTGTATEVETELSELMEELKVIVMDAGGDILEAIKGLDESRWPDIGKAKATIDRDLMDFIKV